MTSQGADEKGFSPSPGRRSRKVRANRKFCSRGFEYSWLVSFRAGFRAGGFWKFLSLYPGENSFFRMKKRKLLAKPPPPPLSRTCPRDAGKFNNFSKARGLLPPEFPRNANISITIDTEGRRPLPLFYPPYFPNLQRVSTLLWGNFSKLYAPPEIVPLLSSCNIFFFTIFTALYFLSKKRKKKRSARMLEREIQFRSE